MASQYESGSYWTIHRLRTGDAAYLAGADRGTVIPPEPIAMAQGPIVTNAGIIGVGDSWVLDTTIPAADLAWVVVQDNLLLQSSQVSGDTIPDSVYWWPQGNNALANALTGPPLGPGVINAGELVASGGTWRWNAVPAVPAPRTTWVPLDPGHTLSGIATTMSAKANATTGPAAAEWRVNMEGCIMLGFPVNMWGTGELWNPMSSRGS